MAKMKCGKGIHFLTFRLPSCLNNFHLKQFYKLYFTNKSTRVYVGIIIYDRIPSGSVVVLFGIFIHNFYIQKNPFKLKLTFRDFYA